MDRLTRESAVTLLKNKYAELGMTRFPRRSDFSDDEVVAIKAFLGPWPRALEAAGVKTPRDGDRPTRSREKHIRAKRRRRGYKTNTDS